MIKQIKIKGYKSLENIEIHLQPFTLLFGLNAAGKSNILDALQLLSRIATCRTLKEAFEAPYRGTPLESFSFGREGLKGLLEKESASFLMEVDVELSPEVIYGVNSQIREMKGSENLTNEKETNYIKEKHLRYKVEVEILPKTGILRVSDECLEAIRRDGKPKASRRPFMEKVGNEIHLRIEGHSHPIYYDLHLDRSIISSPLYAPHYPHMTAMQQELSSWHFYYLEPRERMRLSGHVKEACHLGFMGEELASFLNTMKMSDNEQFNEMVKSLKLIVPSISDIEVDVNEHGEVEFNIIEDGRPVSARVVSEGTLRIIGLLALWRAKEKPAVIGLEEPENGIHPGCIKLAAEFLKNRAGTGNTQLIVTSHSPIFIEMIPDEYLYICRKIDGKTTVEHFSNWGPLSRKSVIDKELEIEEKESSAIQ